MIMPILREVNEVVCIVLIVLACVSPIILISCFVWTDLFSDILQQSRRQIPDEINNEGLEDEKGVFKLLPEPLHYKKQIVTAEAQNFFIGGGK